MLTTQHDNRKQRRTQTHFAGCVWVCAIIRETTYDVNVALPGRNVEWRSTILWIVAIYVRSTTTLWNAGALHRLCWGLLRAPQGNAQSNYNRFEQRSTSAWLQSVGVDKSIMYTQPRAKHLGSCCSGDIGPGVEEELDKVQTTTQRRIPQRRCVVCAALGQRRGSSRATRQGHGGAHPITIRTATRCKRLAQLSYVGSAGCIKHGYIKSRGHAAVEKMTEVCAPDTQRRYTLGHGPRNGDNFKLRILCNDKRLTVQRTSARVRANAWSAKTLTT